MLICTSIRHHRRPYVYRTWHRSNVLATGKLYAGSQFKYHESTHSNKKNILPNLSSYHVALTTVLKIPSNVLESEIYQDYIDEVQKSKSRNNDFRENFRTITRRRYLESKIAEKAEQAIQFIKELIHFLWEFTKKNPKYRLHIGWQMDHKFYEEKKIWALGTMMTISLYSPEEDVIRSSFMLALHECGDPFKSEKSPEVVAKTLVELMQQLDLEEIKNSPNCSYSFDGALSFHIMKSLKKLGWSIPVYSVQTCHGHTVNIFSKQIIEHTDELVKNYLYLGKF